MRKTSIVALIGSAAFVVMMIYTYNLINENRNQNVELIEKQKLISEQKERLEQRNDSLQTLYDAYNQLQTNLRSSIDTIATFLSNSQGTIKPDDFPDFIKEQLNSKYIISMFTINTDEELRHEFVRRLRNKGFSLTPGYDYDFRPSWLAGKPTVFYYSNSSYEKALEIAALLSIDGINFSTQIGAGLGVMEDQEHLTFFIHYIPEDEKIETDSLSTN